MENRIGDGAIKIACIQAVPGYEIKVKNALETYCENDENIQHYITFKGFGTFDIILLYITEDFGNHLRFAGPIPHILKSNLLLCFPFQSRSAQDIYSVLSKHTFTAFCLLKISPGLKRNEPNIDSLIRKFLNKELDNLTILGSLGWNEIIILLSDNNIDSLSNNINLLSELILEKEFVKISVILKTLSFLGIHYDFISKPSCIEKGFKSINYYVRKNDNLTKAKINSHNSKITLSLEVSTKPNFTYEAQSYFPDSVFKKSELVGSRDILIQPRKTISWSYFLSRLLDFRHAYKEKIFSTSTRIGFETILLSGSPTREIPFESELFKFRYSEVEKLFGHSMASSLVNDFYTFNSLFQNPLCGSAYGDMSLYPYYIMEAAKNINDEGDIINIASGARDNIRKGAELRSYGTHETIEEVTGRFSEFRGGCQASLLSIEYIPYFILRKNNIPWMGFVIAGEPKFRHINEVINVPASSLWDPCTWWALYHEIAHIIINSDPDYLTTDIPSVQLFLSNKDYPNAHLDLIIEFAAEIIGFELGFFGDFKTYLTVLWNHLVSIDKFQKKYSPISVYSIRTFIVQLFFSHFRKSTNLERISKEKYMSFDFLFEQFIIHMNDIEKIVKKEIFDNKEFIAAKNIKLITELYPFFKHLSKLMTKNRLSPNKKYINHPNTTKVIKHLKDGKIWWEDIVSPEAVLYQITIDRPLTFNARIATILTFWNQYMSISEERIKEVLRIDSK